MGGVMSVIALSRIIFPWLHIIVSQYPRVRFGDKTSLIFIVLKVSIIPGRTLLLCWAQKVCRLKLNAHFRPHILRAAKVFALRRCKHGKRLLKSFSDVIRNKQMTLYCNLDDSTLLNNHIPNNLTYIHACSLLGVDACSLPGF